MIGEVRAWRSSVVLCLSALLAGCSEDTASSRCPSATEVDVQSGEGVPHALGEPLTLEQKETAWREARSPPWSNEIFAHATTRASFVPIASPSVLTGIAVTVFFDQPVSLPACLPMLSGRGEEDPRPRKITTDTPSRTAPAVTLFVIDGRAQWIALVPQPIADHELATTSEPWDPKT